jgi:quinol monooxygenase YgiN
MKVGLVAIHYPRLGDRQEFIARVQRAVDVLRPMPGCLSVDFWVTAGGDEVVSTGQWESETALAASFATARGAGVDFDFDDRESRPRQVLRLVSP